ncbi:hypothetical protein ACWIFN_44060, partial [Streptomyces adustus]
MLALVLLGGVLLPVGGRLHRARGGGGRRDRRVRRDRGLRGGREQDRFDAGCGEAGGGGLGERDAVAGQAQRHQGFHGCLAAP